MSKTNYEEQLFNSIDLIVEKRIANLDYDKTIICTITDNSNKHNNKYSVSDGSTVFIAQGDGNTYAINDKVRVLIPQGNFSKEKYIQGKHNSDDASKPITYVSPLGSVLKISDNLLSNVSGTYGIVANGSREEIPIGDIIEFSEDYLQNEDIFDTLYVQAQFQTYFEQPDMRDGDYGLHIKLITRTEDEETQEIKYDAYGLYFSAKKDMFGNPYAFKIFTEQEIKYTLSQWPSNVIGLQVFLYQDNNFKYYDDNKPNELQDYKPDDEVVTTLGTSPFNIRVSDIEIGFGSDITNSNSAKLKLYTPDLEIYHSESDTIEDNRTLKLLWYNRSEDNEYIGFSDGKYDSDYNEDEYLAAIALNTRFLAAKAELYPDDEVCLSLAADAKDIKIHCQTLNKIIGTDLPYLLRGFKDYLFGIPFDSDPFAELLGNEDNSLATLSTRYNSQNADSAISILLDYYDKTLKWAKSNDGDQPTLTGDPQGDILSLINYSNTNDTNTIYYLMENLFSIIKNIINTHLSYQSVYNTYEARWNDVKNTLIKIYDKLNIIVSAKTGDDYQESHANLKGLSNMELLASISDKKDSKPYSDKTKSELFKNKWDNRYCIYWYRKDDSITVYDPHLGKTGWERLTDYNNVGIPSEDEQNEGFCAAKTNAGLTIELRRKDEERFCAVMFHNHEKIISTELVFDNLDDVPDLTVMDSIGALSIEHNNKQSQNSYQLYGPDGWLMNVGDAQTKRELRVRFNGETGKDEQLIGAFVYWYVPLISTMVEVYDTVDMQNNFIKIPEEGLDADGTEQENYKPGYACYRHYIGQASIAEEEETPTVCEADTIFPYHIKRLYQQTATQNTILCVVKKGDLTYYASQSFSFSSFGNSGTDYTLALIPNPEYPYVKNAAGYTLYVQTNLYDHNSNQLTIPGSVSNPFSWFGPTGYAASAQTGSSDNLIGCNVSKISGNNCYYGVLNCLIKDVEIPFGESSVKAIDLQSSIPIPYSFNDNFYIEGASSIVYDSNGGNPKYYNNPYVLYNKATNEQWQNIKWSLIHYYPTDINNITYDIFKVNYTDNTICINDAEFIDITLEHIEKYSLNFIPKLDSNNIIIPSPMYITGQNVYSVAVAELITEEDSYTAGTIIWAQPILITQNAYGSSVINKWDGGLVVDNENNMILSAMVGAGRKNERNKFDGVLMGDVGTKAEINSISEIGLYGFHDGAQSFSFKVDGTAILGKAGRGRIHINGNTSTIESASYASENQGMKLDLDDGWISIKGNGEEKIFLDSKNANKPYFKLGTDDTASLMYDKEGVFDIQYDGISVFHIDQDDAVNPEYYLKTKNYEENTNGVRLDLQSGELLANRFKIQAGNTLLLNSHPDDGDAYLKLGTDNGSCLTYAKNGNFDIKYGSKSLLHVTDDEYYLQTSNYPTDEEDNSVGVKLDLKSGELLANQFKIKAGNSLLLDSNPEDDGCYLYMGNPEAMSVEFTYDNSFIIWHGNNALLKVSDSNYFLRTKNYDPLKSEGTQIDLATGAIDSYQFTLTTDKFTLSTNHIDISGTTITSWYNANTMGNVIFKAGTSFALTENGYFFAAAGKISNWNISGNSLTTDTVIGTENSFHMYADGKGGGEQGATVGGGIKKSNWMLTIGQHFGVDNTGAMYASSGKIANWLIGENQLKTDNSVGDANSFHMYADGSGSGTVGGVEDGEGWMLTVGQHFGVNQDGKLYSNALYASGGEIGPLNIYSDSIEFFETKTISESQDISKSTATEGTQFMVQLPGWQPSNPDGSENLPDLNIDYYCNLVENGTPSTHNNKYYYSNPNAGNHSYVAYDKLAIALNSQYCEFAVKVTKPGTTIGLAVAASNCKGIVIFDNTTQEAPFPSNLAGFRYSSQSIWISKYMGEDYIYSLPNGIDTDIMYIRLLNVTKDDVQAVWVAQSRDIYACKMTQEGIKGVFNGEKKLKSDWDQCTHWLGINSNGEIVAYAKEDD